MRVESEIAALAASEQPVMSRRNFIRAVGIGALGLSIGAAIAEEKQQPEPAKEYAGHEPGADPTDHTEAEATWGYADDVELAAKILGAEMVTVAAGKAVGIDFGNAGMEKILRRASEAPLATAVDVAVTSPAAEELVFRAIPSGLADFLDPAGRGNKRWALGACVSLAFAAAHNIGHDKRTIPLPQFIGGLGFWYAQRRGGLNHATFTHAVHNAVPTVALLGLTAAEKSRQEEMEASK